MNDKTSCSIVREKLALYVGDDLDLDATELVRSHLDQCGGCARDAAAAARSRGVFQTSLKEGASELGSANLWGGVSEILAREGRIVSGSAGPVLEPASRTRPIPSIHPDREAAGRPQRSWGLRLVGIGSGLAAAAVLVVTTLLGPTADDGASTRDLVQGPAPTAGPVVVLGSEPVSDPTLGAPTFGEPVFGENEVGLQRVGFEGEALVDDSRAIQVFVPTTPSSSGAGQLAGYQSGARGQGGLRLR